MAKHFKTSAACKLIDYFAVVATQLLEQLLAIPWDCSSNPVIGKIL